MTPAWLRFLPPRLRDRIAGRTYLLGVLDNAGWVLGERILRHAVGFLVGIWIARYVGPEQYGVLNYAGAFVLVFAFLGTMGLEGLVVRDLVREPSGRDRTLGTWLAMRLAGGLLMVGVTALAVAWVQPDDSRAPVMIFLISSAHLLLAFECLDCWFQATVTSRYTVAAKTLSLLATAVLRVVLILTEAPLVAFAWAQLAEFASLAILMLRAYATSGQAVWKLRPSLTRARTLLREGWPLLVSTAVVAIGTRIDQVMLGELASFGEVGDYAVAVRIVEATYVVPLVAAMSVFPALLKSKARDSLQYMARVQKLYDVLVWAAIALAVPLCLFAAPIVQLLVGRPYANAAPVLMLLAWMPVLTFFNIARTRWLYAEDALRALMAVEICSCAFNVLANLLLIPRYGAQGAAIASLAGTAAGTLTVALFSRTIRRSAWMFVRALFAPVRLWSRLRLSDT